MRHFSPRSTKSTACTKENDGGKTTAAGDILTTVKNEIESAGEKISEKLSESASKAKDAVENGATAASEKLSEAGSKIRDGATDVSEIPSVIGEKLTSE